MTATLAVENSTVIETPEHPLLARIIVLPDGRPGERRPKIVGNYLSPSQIKKYVRCSAQYMFQYFYKLKEPTNSASFFGQALHAGAEMYLCLKRDLMLKGESVDHDAVKAQAIETALLYVRTQIPADIIWKTRWQNGPEETFETLLESIKVGVDMMADQVWKDLNAIEIEKGYILEWKDANILPILGYADVVVDTENGPEVRDFKTGREKKAEDAKLDIALSTYAQAYEIQSGRQTRRVGYHSFVRNKEPKIVYVSAERESMDFSRLRVIARTMTKALHSGIYIPVDDAATCSLCHFRERCRQEFA